MSATAPQTGHAPVNGLNMYYEVHGSGGVPLVLLHGGFGTVEADFRKMLPTFAQTRQVVGIEQQAHGHTADIDRPLRYEQMADDTAALLRQIGQEHLGAIPVTRGATEHGWGGRSRLITKGGRAMGTYRRDHGSFEERQWELLRSIVDSGPLGAGHKLAADDMRERLLAAAELDRRLEEAGVRSAGVGSILAATRRGLGSLLVRVGERIQDAPVDNPVAQTGFASPSSVR